MRLNLAAPLTVDAAPADEAPRRTISGIAVPYGITAHASTGRVRFRRSRARSGERALRGALGPA